MTGAFYDGVASRGLGYTPEQLASFVPDVEGTEPETRFTQLAIESLPAGGMAVDVGTGDASWFMSHIAPRARHAIGLDAGRLRLLEGSTARTELGLSNVELILGDASAMPLRDGVVDVVISRRGPVTINAFTLSEAYRVMRSGGLLVTIEIGEQNCREVTEVFGRSQMTEEASVGRRLPRLVSTLEAQGLSAEIAADYETFEYFKNRAHLEHRFRTAPILYPEDFDSVEHAGLLDELVARNQTPRGTRITYHRLVLTARKS